MIVNLLDLLIIWQAQGNPLYWDADVSYKLLPTLKGDAASLTNNPAQLSQQISQPLLRSLIIQLFNVWNFFKF